MKHTINGGAASRAWHALVMFVTLCLAMLATPALAALTLSPTSVSVPARTYATVKITGAAGEIQAESSNTAVATVALSNVTTSSATLTVYGVGAGSTTVKVRDAVTSNKSVAVTVTKSMTISPTSLSLTVGSSGKITASNYSGALTASVANTSVAAATVAANVVTVKALAAGSTVLTLKDSVVTWSVPVTVLAVSGGTARYSLIAWNDLGMHCMDGKDYSVFSILPPFNNLHAQLVNASTGKAVTTGVVLTYEAVADPTGSINTTSSNKTNFWTYVKSLYGASPADNQGLTLNYTPSKTARPMTLDAVNGWFEATGLPITPYDDSGAKNYYPTVKVVAKDLTGKVLATTTTVLPVSDEITCAACHASRPGTETNSARLAARPAAGWVNNADPEKDWKLNILRLHDERQKTNSNFAAALTAVGLNASGLEASALAGKPTLCAACHGSNALGTTSQPGAGALTKVQHASHGKVIDPTTVTQASPGGLKLDASSNRSACYMCHPGSVTKCLRGVMGEAVDANGNASINCQSCHGNMTNVGDPLRVGWLDQPTCQACHYDGKRTLTALDANLDVVVPKDRTFATNDAAPSAPFNLYRFSKGHGGLQCEACHGATHAEYPSAHANDNLQSITLQGYAGTVRECVVCHANTPTAYGNGGPHGMHLIGTTWVSGHESFVSANGKASCAYCHGSDYKGSPLAQVKVAKSFAIENGRTKTYAAGDKVGCFDCHN